MNMLGINCGSVRYENFEIEIEYVEKQEDSKYNTNINSGLFVYDRTKLIQIGKNYIGIHYRSVNSDEVLLVSSRFREVNRFKFAEYNKATNEVTFFS